MSCDEVTELLPDYALGGVSETEAAGVRRHLRGCATCREEAERLDQGLSLFSAAVHEAEPPKELEDRVLQVLKDEWFDSAVRAEGRRPPRPLTRRSVLAIAAAVVVIAGSLTWGAVNQVRASRLASDATSLRTLLDTLGGKEVRVGSLRPVGDGVWSGSFLLYDGTAPGDSWVLVLAKAPGYTGPANVDLVSRDGKKRIPLHPMEMEQDGEGWTGLFSQSDLTMFDQVRVTSPSGRLLASGRAIRSHD